MSTVALYLMNIVLQKYPLTICYKVVVFLSLMAFKYAWLLNLSVLTAKDKLPST